MLSKNVATYILITRYIKCTGKVFGIRLPVMTKTCFWRTIYSSQVLYRRSKRYANVSGENLRQNNNLEFPAIPDICKRSDSKSSSLNNAEITVLQNNITDFKQDLTLNDKLFTKIALLYKNRKHRERKNILFLEGTSLIEMAINSGIQLQSVFYSKEEALPALDAFNLANDKIFKVKDKTLRFLSGRDASSGIIGICEKPTIKEATSAPLPVTILCSNIRDPNNMGDIIACAVATGCKSILLTKGCVDAWERKVLTSANGAHFNIPIVNNIDWADIMNYIPNNASFYIADSSADIDVDDSEIYSEVNYAKENKTNHLNFLDETKVEMNSEEHQLQESINSQLPCHLYFVTFPNNHIVLCIGGETEGINSKIVQLGYAMQGQKLKIPLENGMDSLNVSCALSIILFEIKRQFTKNASLSHS